MTTREQRLRELVSKWRSGQNYYFAKSVSEKCADELAAILAEPVEVSDEMCIRGLAEITITDPNAEDMRIARGILTAALKEPGQ